MGRPGSLFGLLEGPLCRGGGTGCTSDTDRPEALEVPKPANKRGKSSIGGTLEVAGPGDEVGGATSVTDGIGGICGEVADMDETGGDRFCFFVGPPHMLSDQFQLGFTIQAVEIARTARSCL